jgi:hypothetical protein
VSGTAFIITREHRKRTVLKVLSQSPLVLLVSLCLPNCHVVVKISTQHLTPPPQYVMYFTYGHTASASEPDRSSATQEINLYVDTKFSIPVLVKPCLFLTGKFNVYKTRIVHTK